MKKQMKIGYNLHWSAYVTETINITSKLLSELNLDKNAIIPLLLWVNQHTLI